MSEEGRRARDLRQTLVPIGFRRDRSKTRAYSYRGLLKAAGREIVVAITFRDLEFTRLPTLTLLEPDREAPHVVAHLSASGALCFARDEDIVLDRYNVGGSALVCLELARRGIERALTHKHLEREIAQEFPQHWLGTPFYYDVSATRHEHAKLYCVRSDQHSTYLLLANSDRILKRLMCDEAERRAAIASARPAFVFRSDANLTFSQAFRQPATIEDFLSWLEDSLQGTRSRAVEKLTSQFPKHLIPLFVNAPNGCVGVMVEPSAVVRSAQRRVGLRRIVQANRGKISVERYSGARADLPFIFQRNMNKHAPLFGRNIALIGCGTIGSHLAKFLVQSGAGHEGGRLLLLDNQTLEPSNVGRHYLGTTSIGVSKPTGLKRELGRQFPEACILPMTADAEASFRTLTGYDLVLDATGEEALSMSINQYFVELRRTERSAPDVIYVRLFGNGVAAQTLLVDGAAFACLKCLRPQHGGNWRFNPLKSGVAATQTVAACGEAQYIAYAVAAPAMAAALGLQLVLDWNTGAPSPRMRTLRIDKRDTQEVADKNPTKAKGCPACDSQTQ